MSKKSSKTIYTCQTCGAQRLRWEGKCSDCGSWNSLVEEVQKAVSPNSWAAKSLGGGFKGVQSSQVVALGESFKVQLERYSTGIQELDRVLGGGLVKGSLVLLGGAPGVGKSTLLLQMVGGLKRRILYVSGEESVDQTSNRAERLGVKSSTVWLASEGNLEAILELVEKSQPEVLIVDSIQTVYWSQIQAAPGSVSQVRECAGQLMMLAKSKGISVILVGHVTKEGSLAGPKVLEHMVDAVLAFEGEMGDQYRLLRSLKNRFGAAFELGVFTMNEMGLKEVLNPSELFLDLNSVEKEGSCIYASMEGTRTVLCEIQALVVPTYLPAPRRTSMGVDVNRVHLLAAILEKRLGVQLGKMDLFVNVAGGLRLSEPSVDLAVAGAVISSDRSVVLPNRSLFFGEIGLSGEVRPVPFSELRIKEALRLGFREFFVPRGNQEAIQKELKAHKEFSSIRCHWIKDLGDLVAALSERSSLQMKRQRGSSPTEKSKTKEDFIPKEV